MCQRRRKMERRSWEELPRDCLENVFQRLGLEDLSVGVPFVCKSWYEVSLNPIFWENIDLGDMNLVNSPFVERFKAEYHLQAFSFSLFLKFFIGRGRRSTSKLIFPTRGVSLDDLVYVSEKCPGLKFLELPRHFNSKEVEKHVPTLIARWKELQWLSMDEMRSSFKEVLTEINRHCGNFLGLKVRRGSICEEEATCIAVLLPKINHLDLSRCYISNNRLMKIMEGCRELKEVDVRSCIGLDINDEILKMAASLEKFEHEGCIKHIPRYCGLAGAAAMRRLEPGQPRFIRRAHQSSMNHNHAI